MAEKNIGAPETRKLMPRHLCAYHKLPASDWLACHSKMVTYRSGFERLGIIGLFHGELVKMRI